MKIGEFRKKNTDTIQSLAWYGMAAGGMIYAHKNTVKSKECILRTPTAYKHTCILPHDAYQMMENNDQIAAALRYFLRSYVRVQT